jgi:hypothetical protein
MLGSHKVLRENYRLLGCDIVPSGSLSTLKRGWYVSLNVDVKFLPGCTTRSAEERNIYLFILFVVY